MHKALTGFSSHEERLEIPIVENTQDMVRSLRHWSLVCRRRCSWPGYLIRGMVSTLGESQLRSPSVT